MADQGKSKFSLRTKARRTKDVLPSVPKVRDDYRPAGNTSEPPRARPRPKHNADSTSNLIKKRLSLRYNQDFSLNDPPPLPGLPSVPLQYALQNGRRDPSPAQRPRALDAGALSNPGLQVDQHVTSFLTEASEQDILEYQKNLKKAQNRASTDLQHNAYKNRTQFIKISKEAEKLKGEMQTLRSIMSDLTATLGQSSQPDHEITGLDEGARKRANRSSLANLEAMWNTQLQTLWRTIEGSQRYLAAIPGRHVVHEAGQWSGLDAATWKHKHTVHIVLLNDHLLIALKKRKKIDPNANQKAPTKLIADRCFSLHDIELIDLATSTTEHRGPSDARMLANAISIRHGHESFTYRHENPKAKMELLTCFKRTVDELHRAERAEGADAGTKSKDAMSHRAARDPATSREAGLLQTLSKSNDRPEVLIDVDGKQRNLRWVEGQIDELDIEIALQRFEEAVDHVEQLRRLAKTIKGNTVAQDVINVKVDARASSLADILAQNLISAHNFLTATQTYTSYLARLDFATRARTAYLSARTAAIRKRARQCVFEGNILAHVTELGVVYFTLVRNTVTVYQQCFPLAMMSACVVWAKEHLDGFNEALERALSGVEKGGTVWREGLERARELAGMMDEVGLDFKPLVGRGLE